jgi:hypothetical protein
VADEVSQTADRHLFPDASRRRHGPPRIGSRTSIVAQPARVPAPTKPASGSWWYHTGTLAVVFTGLPGGDLVLPVRLPAGAGQWPHLVHFLADPTVWHKIDLVRVRDRRAPGGWRYYAYLLTNLGPAIRHRRPGLGGPRFLAVGAPGWMPTCPTWRWCPSPTTGPSSWWSTRSPALPNNNAPRSKPHARPQRAAGVGPVPAQYQRRPVRPITTAGCPGGSPRVSRRAG